DGSLAARRSCQRSGIHVLLVDIPATLNGQSESIDADCLLAMDHRIVFCIYRSWPIIACSHRRSDPLPHLHRGQLHLRLCPDPSDLDESCSGRVAAHSLALVIRTDSM